MAKFFKRLGSKKERFLVLMKILSLELSVQEPVERISIEWKRGEKKSETKAIFELGPQKHQTQINETFSKSSVFYYAPKSQSYFKKLAQIRVKGFIFGKEKHLGEVELDISQFVGAQNQVRTLQLTKTPPKTARANITIQLSIVRDQTDQSKASHDKGGDAQRAGDSDESSSSDGGNFSDKETKQRAFT